MSTLHTGSWFAGLPSVSREDTSRSVCGRRLAHNLPDVQSLTSAPCCHYPPLPNFRPEQVARSGKKRPVEVATEPAGSESKALTKEENSVRGPSIGAISQLCDRLYCVPTQNSGRSPKVLCISRRSSKCPPRDNNAYMRSLAWALIQLGQKDDTCTGYREESLKMR